MMLRRSVAGLLILLAGTAPLPSAQPGAVKNADGKDSDKEAARKMRLDEMKRIAGQFTIKSSDADDAPAVSLGSAPLLRFDDPTRDFHDATLWAFGDEGRPLCLLAMEQYGGQWWFEMISLVETDQRPAVVLSAAGGPQLWKPQSAGLTFQPFPGAPKPAKDAPKRLSQMKDLARQLSAHELGFDKEALRTPTPGPADRPLCRRTGPRRRDFRLRQRHQSRAARRPRGRRRGRRIRRLARRLPALRHRRGARPLQRGGTLHHPLRPHRRPLRLLLQLPPHPQKTDSRRHRTALGIV